MYPFYEKAIKSGINTICIHKGLMPRDYEKAFAGTWESATVKDLGKAAKDWPGMNFVIYHSALRPWLADQPDKDLQAFLDTGYVQWATDLARIPEKFGVNNVYAEIGSTFASTAVTNPRFCAAFIGQLVNLMGAERVVWGSDSVWYGSPQWQIEAMRRLEIPDDIMKKFKWKTRLGGPNSEVKQKIFGLNSATPLRPGHEDQRRQALHPGPDRPDQGGLHRHGRRAQQRVLTGMSPRATQLHRHSCSLKFRP